ILAAMRKCIGEGGTVNPVILVPMDIRRFTRKIIEREFRHIQVLSFQELSYNANVQALDRISYVTPRTEPAQRPLAQLPEPEQDPEEHFDHDDDEFDDEFFDEDDEAVMN